MALDRTDEYLTAWDAVRTAVETAGGRAWVFRGAAHEDHFLEFIEWSATASPLEDGRVTAALEALDAFAPAGWMEEWEEAP